MSGRPSPGPRALPSRSTPAPFTHQTQVHPDGLCLVLPLAPWSCAEDLGRADSGGETWLPPQMRPPWGCPWRPQEGPLLSMETLGFP